MNASPIIGRPLFPLYQCPWIHLFPVFLMKPAVLWVKKCWKFCFKFRIERFRRTSDHPRLAMLTPVTKLHVMQTNGDSLKQDTQASQQEGNTANSDHKREQVKLNHHSEEGCFSSLRKSQTIFWSCSRVATSLPICLLCSPCLCVCVYANSNRNTFVHDAAVCFRILAGNGAVLHTSGSDRVHTSHFCDLMKVWLVANQCSV